MISCEHVQPQLFSICSFTEKNIVETNIEMTLPPNIPSLTLKGFKWLILRFLYPGKRASVLGTISNKITSNKEPFNFLE